MVMMDREKVISELDTQIRWIEDIDAHKFPGWCGATMAMRYAMMLLKEQEAVVRCKDCKFHHASEKLNLCWCEKDFIEGLHSRDWYCADGERK